jgi:hypothetical protein
VTAFYSREAEQDTDTFAIDVMPASATLPPTPPP